MRKRMLVEMMIIITMSRGIEPRQGLGLVEKAATAGVIDREP